LASDLTTLRTADAVRLEAPDQRGDTIGILSSTDDVPLAVVTERLSALKRTSRPVVRWVLYQKRGLSRLSHHLEIRSPGGEPIFSVAAPHTRLFRRLRLNVTGPSGEPLGRLERTPGLRTWWRLRLIGPGGEPLGELRYRRWLRLTLLGGDGQEIASHRIEYPGGPWTISFAATATGAQRLIVLSHALLIYLCR
jgi:hypothetical protein